MNYDQMKELSLERLDHPQPGDYWHERLCPILVVLEVMPEGTIIVADKTEKVDGGHFTFVLENAIALTHEEFIKNLCYRTKPGTPIGLVSTGPKFRLFVDEWKAGVRDKVFARLLAGKKKVDDPICVEDLKSWLEDQTIEYASMTKDGYRLRLLVAPATSTTSKFRVTLGNKSLYQGPCIKTAVSVFNETYNGE